MRTRKHSFREPSALRSAFVWLAGLALLASCEMDGRSESRSYADRVSSYEGGLRKRERAGRLSVDLQYLPPSYLALQRGVSADSVSDLLHFTLRVTVDAENGSAASEAGAKREAEMPGQDYLAFGLERDLTLEQAGDSIPCALFHYEPSSLRAASPVGARSL